MLLTIINNQFITNESEIYVRQNEEVLRFTIKIRRGIKKTIKGGVLAGYVSALQGQTLRLIGTALALVGTGQDLLASSLV